MLCTTHANTLVREGGGVREAPISPLICATSVPLHTVKNYPRSAFFPPRLSLPDMAAAFRPARARSPLLDDEKGCVCSRPACPTLVTSGGRVEGALVSETRLAAAGYSSGHYQCVQGEAFQPRGGRKGGVGKKVLSKVDETALTHGRSTVYWYPSCSPCYGC